MRPENRVSRFWSAIEPDTNGGCWLWSGHTINGYGSIAVNGVQMGAHRMAWELLRGPIQDGLCALHKCDVRACVNPDHLFLGTKGENNSDRSAKGRNADKRGERHHRAKLTVADVEKIRELAANTPHQKLAEAFGVCRQTVSDIITRRRWAHV